MPTMEEVTHKTTEFFELHWNESKLGREAPTWSPKAWELYGPISQDDGPGCYAFSDGQEIIYIGVGARKGNGRYLDCGIGARLNDYLGVDESRPGNYPNRYYKFKPPKPGKSDWAQVKGIYTIFFPKGRGYLAYALESFLVSNLKPRENINRPGTVAQIVVSEEPCTPVA